MERNKNTKEVNLEKNGTGGLGEKIKREASEGVAI